jgi:hypothetical protein
LPEFKAKLAWEGPLSPYYVASISAVRLEQTTTRANRAARKGFKERIALAFGDAPATRMVLIFGAEPPFFDNP